MIAVPETRYARSEHGNIAYQVTGDGPIDVVFVGDWMNHVEWQWGGATVSIRIPADSTVHTTSG